MQLARSSQNGSRGPEPAPVVSPGDHAIFGVLDLGQQFIVNLACIENPNFLALQPVEMHQLLWTNLGTDHAVMRRDLNHAVAIDLFTYSAELPREGTGGNVLRLRHPCGHL